MISIKRFPHLMVIVVCFFFVSCRLTHNFATGTWLDGKDTLQLKTDGSFLYKDYRGYYQKNSDEIDRGTDERNGIWYSRANCITLMFRNGTQPGKDTSLALCRRMGQSRYQVHHTESYPSNRFRTFYKISK